MAWVIGIGIFLFLLFAFPRAVGSLIVLIVLAAGGFFLWDKAQGDARNRLRASVLVSVSHDLNQCSAEYPLLIQISNGSELTMEKVSFGLEGKRHGYSEPIYDSGYLGYSSDKIIMSGERWSNCWTLPKRSNGAHEQTFTLNPPENLIWDVKNSSPIFQEN